MYFLKELLNKPEALQEFIKRAFPGKEQHVSNLLQFLRQTDNPLYQQYIEYNIIRPGLANLQKNLEDPFHCDLPVEYLQGDIAVGYWSSNPREPITQSFDSSNLTGHILCGGTTGSGKSVFNMHIIDQIIKKRFGSDLRVLVFTSKKFCEHRNLVWNNKHLKGAVHFLDSSTFSINCFSPINNVDNKLMISDCARSTATQLGIQMGGQLFLQSKITDYLSENPCGNLFDFTHWLSRKKVTGLDYIGYKNRLVNRLLAVMDEIGSIYNCYSGISDSHFIQENIIIEIPCSNTFIMALLTSQIMQRIFRYKSCNPETLFLKNIILLEDIQGGLRRYE